MMCIMRQSAVLAERLVSIVVLLVMGCVFVSSSRGTASAQLTSGLTAPANNAVVSGTISLSCTVPSNVEWINLDVDNSFYASGSAYATSYTTTWNSASVANGSHSNACAGYGSNGALIVNSVANITVSNSVAGCTTMPGTNTPVGAACFPYVYPALNNPQNPVASGADPTGVSDSTSAINTALAAGDAYFSTPGTYLVALTGATEATSSIVPPAGRNIECVPGVTIIERTSTPCGGQDCGIFGLQNGGNTIAGCDIRGGNSTAGPQQLSASQSGESIQISSNNDTVEGCTFEDTYSNSAIQVNSSYTAIYPSNYLIQYNTFSHNPYYGPEVDVATSGTIQNNLVIDGGLGMENDACSSSNGVGTAIIQNNELTVSVGDCAVAGTPGCYGEAMINGGVYPPGCDYSGVRVMNNYCQGNATQMAQIANYSPGGGGSPASFSGNLLGPYCSCGTGSSC
jgi:hypothetical protein